MKVVNQAPQRKIVIEIGPHLAEVVNQMVKLRYHQGESIKPDKIIESLANIILADGLKDE
jgi:hypothetical protein